MTRRGAVRRATDAGRATAAGARSAGLIWALGAGAVGCGGAAPLLHPAQTLPPDTVTFGAGLSGQFASPAVEKRIDRGRAAASGPLADPATASAYAAGVLTQALIAPGISPWVAARVGLPSALEAGLTYTGRSLRLDGRHALSLENDWALSLGVGASAVLLHPDSSPLNDTATDAGPATSEAEFGLDASGWGADIPVLIGYQPLDGLVDVWFGARAGFEHITGDLSARVDDPVAERFDAEGNRLWAGALAGFSLGIPPLWFRFELAGTFHHLTGRVTSPDSDMPPAFGQVDASGWSLAPSGAILGKF
jgi:hypothetical protein